jgi:hypothetical protein
MGRHVILTIEQTVALYGIVVRDRRFWMLIALARDLQEGNEEDYAQCPLVV